MRRLSTAVLGLFVVYVVVIGAGCGSGGTESLVGEPGGTGSLHIAVNFPPRDGVTPQNLPLATNSVHIKVENQGGIVDEACLVRPDSSITFTGVPAGNTTVTADAYQSPDCTGTIVATCSDTVNVIAGQTATVTLIAQPLVIWGEAYILDSVLTGQQEPLQDPAAIIGIEMGTGDTVDVYTVWYDVDDNQMLPDDVTWSSTDDTVATVAVLNPLLPDYAQITGTFADTGFGTCQIIASATPEGQQVLLAQMGGTMPSPEVVIDVTVNATGAMDVVIE